MLPFLNCAQATSTLDFSQLNDFPLVLSGTMRDGVCLGLSMMWLRSVKKGEQDFFKSSLGLVSSIVKIEHIYQQNASARGSAFMAMVQHCGWNSMDREAQLLPPNGEQKVTSLSVKSAIEKCSGYLIFGAYKVGEADGHATALYIPENKSLPCQFFDPNLGSAKFPSFKQFLQWFATFYWTASGGPGCAAGCKEFNIDKFLPAEPVFIAPAPPVLAASPVVKPDFSQGPPMTLSQIKALAKAKMSPPG
jgi:YopT-type cysteine protease-like protein